MAHPTTHTRTCEERLRSSGSTSAVRVPKERGHADQQVLVQGIDLVWVQLDVACVIGEVIDVPQGCTPPDAAQQQPVSIAPEVALLARVQQLEDSLHGLRQRRAIVEVRSMKEPHD